MRSLLAIPVLSLAFAGAHARPPAITSAEAVNAMRVQIHSRVQARLRGGYSSETLCSGQGPGGTAIGATTRLARWRCALELKGRRFPSPCRAQADVSVVARPHHVRLVRVHWLQMSRYCR
ncbi:MAG TPA: hypothetical protein VK790_00740 [Solirubrobacteraceae bacterium]|nr:hypothetical protein [Solirubrobacteraceae bacterium]